MKFVIALLIGILVASSLTVMQWMQARRLRRSAPARRADSDPNRSSGFSEDYPSAARAQSRTW